MKNIIKLTAVSSVNDKEYAVIETNGFCFRGQDTLSGYNLECGKCPQILAQDIAYEQLRNLVLHCQCGAHNMVKLNWKFYIFKYLREKFNYRVVITGLVLILLIATIENIPTQTKIFLEVSVFIISFGYKYIEQVFEEHIS